SSISCFARRLRFAEHGAVVHRNVPSTSVSPEVGNAHAQIRAAREDPHLQHHDDMRRAFCSATIVALATISLSGQTRITPPSNKYSPAQDVELGQQAAREARQQLPIMR